MDVIHLKTRSGGDGAPPYEDRLLANRNHSSIVGQASAPAGGTDAAVMPNSAGTEPRPTKTMRICYYRCAWHPCNSIFFCYD